MTIRWASLITTPGGEVDPARLKSTAAVGLAVLGGLIMVMAAVVELVTS